MYMLDLIRNLSVLGITLFVKDGQLKSRGPKGVLTNELSEAIKSNKVELIRLLDIKAIIAKIWCLVLGVNDVDYEDDFFEVGGHSLLATQLMGKLQNKFELSLNIKFIYQYRTLLDMSMQLEILLALKDIKKIKKDQGYQGDEIIF
jgi:acyl carrier protein